MSSQRPWQNRGDKSKRRAASPSRARPPDRAERWARPEKDGPALLYGWHTVKAALDNPDRRILRILATENAARRLAEEGVALPLAPEIVRPDAIARRLGPEAVHQGLLAEAFRVLRAGGLLALETVNPRSVVGFLEVYNRDLSHERPLHPDTLAFMAAAAGFTDVRVEYRSAVDAASRLQPVPTDGLPEPAARVLNENLERLNAVIYAPQEYVLFATR